MGTAKPEIPVITTCCMRHLYASKNELVIGHAKQFERRRCNHQNLEEPLSAFECLASVVDPKGSKTNKNHYVLACQDEKVRTLMRTIPGVPLIYLKRSVMIMEPMAGASEEYKSKVEASKFASGVQGQRDVERAEQDPADRTASMTITTGKEDSDGNIEADDQSEVANQPAKKRKRGPTGPNPLSVKKPKKQPVSNAAAPGNDGKDGLRAKRRRKRQSKSEVEQAT